MIILSPIVGAHFRPPAKLLLTILPINSPLHLDPDPDNPYDPNAVKVLIFPADPAIATSLSLLSSEERKQELLGMGVSLEDLLTLPSIQLGFLPSSSNQKTRTINGTLYAGNAEVLNAIAGSPLHSAFLTFAPNGAALVKILVEGVEGLVEEVGASQ